MNRLDCRAQRCPAPVIETRKLLLGNPGEAVEVLVADDVARDNVSRLAHTLGYQVTVEAESGGFSLKMQPGKIDGTETTAAKAVSGKTVVFVASDRMGEGDAELGTVLMQNFLLTLTQLAAPPEAVLFVNAGVKLCTNGAETIEALENLACAGIDIASCGLCLEFYELKEQLKVGRITNMLDIVETLSQAERIIRP
ncbi:MAG: sulfurtransferase-like selenium metabolism protein YedF [Desulfuromonas sp.]|nr:MAG: sulfurtransferase-like selenium metabolism protein YedF [Desulfuromonas sp.]